MDRSSETETRARVEAQLVRQRDPGGLERAQGLGLTTAPVQGDHSLGEEVLPQRVGGAEGLELGDEVGMAAELELGVHASLQEGEPELGEPGRLDQHDGEVPEVGQGIASPAGQGLAVEVDGLRRVVGRQVPGSVAQGLHSAEVDGDLRGQLIAAGPGGDGVREIEGPEGLADLQHQVLEDLRGRPRGVVAPDPVDQGGLGHHGVAGQGQDRQDRPLLGHAELDRSALGLHPNRSE